MTSDASAVAKNDATRPKPEFYDENDSDNICFLCGEPKYTTTHEVTHYGFPFKFQRCRCGLEKQTPMPNEKFFEWFFNSDLFYSAKESKSKKIWGFYDYFKDEPCRMATSRHRYKKLRDIFEVSRPLNIMKIGPSTGTMLSVAKEYGHNVLGCDVSSGFVQYAKEHYGVQIDHGRFERMPYEDEQFDVVMLFNVVENIPNQDEFFRAVYKKLKKNGYFIVNHVEMKGNLIAALQKEKYFIYRPPICYVYEGRVLQTILEKYGFKQVRRLRDIRYLHMEKILTLLDWPLPLRILKFLHLERVMFPIYAYPSQITVSQKT